MPNISIPDAVPPSARRRFNDRVGERHGRLVVLRYERYEAGHHWLCRCDCGNEKLIRFRNTGEGVTKSCGCINDELRSAPKLDDDQGFWNRVIYNMKKGAKTRSIVWELEDEDVKVLASQDCFYCDSSPSNIYRRPKSGAEFRYNGLDRMENTKGYAIENVVPCCKRCNIAKNDMTFGEFVDWLRRISGSVPKRFEAITQILELYA